MPKRQYEVLPGGHGSRIKIHARGRAVLRNPGPLALWGALLMGITLLGMSTLLLGLIVAVPWLSYASWHAYRDLVPRTDLESA